MPVKVGKYGAKAGLTASGHKRSLYDVAKIMEKRLSRGEGIFTKIVEVSDDIVWLLTTEVVAFGPASAPAEQISELMALALKGDPDSAFPGPLLAEMEDPYLSGKEPRHSIKDNQVMLKTSWCLVSFDTVGLGFLVVTLEGLYGW